LIAALYNGIWEVGKSMMDPFDWNEPRIDLTAVGRRINSEAQRITEVGLYKLNAVDPYLESVCCGTTKICFYHM
jgi:putative membrane protein